MSLAYDDRKGIGVNPEGTHPRLLDFITVNKAAMGPC